MNLVSLAENMVVSTMNGRPKSSVSSTEQVPMKSAALGGGRAQHRVDQPRELLVELGAREVEELPCALAALGDHTGVQQGIEVVARGRLRHRDDHRAATELAAVATRKLTDDLEPDRVRQGLDDVEAVGICVSGCLFDRHRTLLYGCDRTIANGLAAANCSVPTELRQR